MALALTPPARGLLRPWRCGLRNGLEGFLAVGEADLKRLGTFPKPLLFGQFPTPSGPSWAEDDQLREVLGLLGLTTEAGSSALHVPSDPASRPESGLGP